MSDDDCGRLDGGKRSFDAYIGAEVVGQRLQSTTLCECILTYGTMTMIIFIAANFELETSRRA